ncbi:M23 family metallopeptidase [Candidatus Woesearchaeota archaeon]|nr:M23 family metallopeptidase [Candidatus Woesearchaeota archaeon]
MIKRKKSQNKKAQVYPLFVLFFTIAALTFALIKLNDVKKVTDLQGNEIFIGTKQAAVFAALQDADSISLFLDTASELSAQQAITKIRNSCFAGFDAEADVDEMVSHCGKYVYPQWSNNNTLCFPDCETAFLNAFYDDFLARTGDYIRLTGVELPISYNLSTESFEDHFILRGLADSSSGFNVLSMESRINNPAARMLAYSGGKLAWPVQTMVRNVHSCFGWRLLDNKVDYHPGIDISAGAGTPVVASASGRVFATDDCWGRVVVYHGSGLSTEYVHLGSISVKVDQEVAVGDVLGTVGGRGKVNGNGACRADAYPPHLHFAVLYKYVDPNLSYKGQKLAIHSFGTTDHIQPECLLDDDYSKQGTGCARPVNTELDEVCELYNLPEELFSPSSQESQIPDYLLDPSYPVALGERASTGGTDTLSTSTGFGTYSFKPSFTTRVNKNFNDPLKPVAEWFEQAWNACEDDPKNCLTEKMGEFNKQQDNIYTLAFASNPKCEDYPLFSGMIEFFEDCFASNAYACSCEFDFSKAYSRKDMNIIFDTELNTASLLIKEGDVYKRIRDYQFSHGKLKPVDDSHKQYSYVLDFDDKTSRLSSAKMINLPVEDLVTFSFDNLFSQVYVFDNYPVLKLQKIGNDEAKFFNDKADDNKNKCQINKDKFRLCAYPSDPARTDLMTVRFAFQMKDQPPKPLEKGEVKLVETAVGPKDDTNKVIDAALSFVPVLGEIFSLYNAINDITDTKESSFQVIVDAPKDENGKLLDIAGYEVYCNDYLTEMLQEDVLKNFAPSRFVTVANQELNNQLGTMQRYVDSNPYSKFLSGAECDVPVTKHDGETVSVPGIKGIYEGDKVIFNLNTCGGLPVFLDKFIRKNYCVTLIPVDKNGNKMNAEAISNCVQTNSILDTVVDDLLKQGFASIIPFDLLPDDIKPYINLPTSGDITNMLSGQAGSFKLVDMVNVDKLSSDLQGDVVSSILSSINNDMVSSALTKSLDDMGSWEKQVVMSTLSSQLSNTESLMLFEKVVYGDNVDYYVKQKAVEKGIDYIDSSEAPEILKNIAKGEDPSSFAYNYLIEAAGQMDPADKAQDLLDVAKGSGGSDLSQKLIQVADQKGCFENSEVNVDNALNCLRSDEINDFYQDYLKDYNALTSGQQALIDRSIDRMGGSQSSDVLKQIATNTDPYSIASQLLDEAMKEMPDWAKSEMIYDVMDGRLPDAEMLQSELLKMIPDINSEMLGGLVSDGNLNSLLRGNMEQYLQSQLNSFLQGGCTSSQG